MGGQVREALAETRSNITDKKDVFEGTLQTAEKLEASALSPVGTTTIQFAVTDELRLKPEFRQQSYKAPEKKDSESTEKKESWFDRTWVGRFWNWLWS